MALTVTLSGDWLMNLGNRTGVVGTLAFDSSYVTGGEALTAAALGLGEMDAFMPEQGEDGYLFEWVRSSPTTGLLKGYRAQPASSIPTLIVEESVTVAANVGTLAHLPAYIVGVEVTAGGSTPHCHVVPVGETPAQSEVAVDFTTGGLTFNGTDAVTAVLVTYFPQKEGTIFDASNLVVDEAVVASASKTELANRAFAVQYVYNGTNGARCVLEPVGEAPSATQTAVVDITNGTPTTDIDTHADDDGDSLKVTYLKYSGLDNALQAINDTDVTLSSEAYNWATDGGVAGALVVPGLGTQLVGETGAAANLESAWGGPSTTAAAGIAEWHPFDNRILTNETVAMGTTAIPWFKIPTGVDIGAALTGAGGETALTEIPNGVDLSGVSIRFFAVGR